MINQVTAIMPTHNRHQYLARALDYYESIDLKFRLIVLDSSAIRYLKEINCKNIIYVHCPEKNFLGKINDTLSEVTTDFALLCADDDFIIQDGLAGCLHFLEENKDFVATQGLVTRFINLGEIIHMPDQIISLGKSFDSDIAEERLRKGILESYTQTFYSVYRTKTLKKIINEATALNYNLFELFITISTYTLGKYAVTPNYYYVREEVEFSEGKNITGIESFITYEKVKLKNDYDRFLLALESIGSDANIKKSFYSDLIINYALKFDPKILQPGNNLIRRMNIIIFSWIKKPITFFLKGRVLILTKKESLCKIDLVKHIPEFPFNNPEAGEQLKAISYFIKKHNLRSF